MQMAHYKLTIFIIIINCKGLGGLPEGVLW